MISVAVVCGDERAPCGCAAIDKIAPGTERDRRYAEPRK